MYIVAIAVLISFFFVLDLFTVPKKPGMFFLRTILYVLTVTAPTIFRTVAGNGDTELLSAWNSYFYIPFAISFFMFFMLAYFAVFKHRLRSLEQYSGAKLYSLLDLFILGYNGFSDEIEKEKKRIENRRSKAFARSFQEMSGALRRYMKDIHLALLDDSYPIDEFILLVLNGLITNVFSHNDARFTLREYDPTSNCMVTRYSTRVDRAPAPIPLDRRNMISTSMNRGRPVIYSNSKSDHYDTGDSLQNKEYRNYVSYCILRDKRKPKLSVNLDVRTEPAEEKMFALVDSSIFAVVCETIVLKYQRTIEKENTTDG